MWYRYHIAHYVDEVRVKLYYIPQKFLTVQFTDDNFLPEGECGEWPVGFVAVNVAHGHDDVLFMTTSYLKVSVVSGR
jgi:hypothetical protein